MWILIVSSRISGAIHRRVPTFKFAAASFSSLALDRLLAAGGMTPGWGGRCNTARPRSAIQHSPSDITRMFLDFTSRWAMAGLPWHTHTAPVTQCPTQNLLSTLSASQPASQSVSQPASQPASQSVSQPASQPASQSVSQSVSQPASQPVSQPASQPINQYFSKEI